MRERYEQRLFRILAEAGHPPIRILTITPEELVEVLCGYMKSDCRLKDFYRARQDDFFAFDDRDSCRRIYEDALSLSRKRS